MSTPHISVVIPAYNEELFIDPCLDALAMQTQQPDIIYIIDNNSTDRTRAIAQSYAGVVIIYEAMQGICAATKRGLDVASQHDGIILRCDADCQPKPDWIETMVDHFTSQAGIVAVTGPGVAYDVGSIAAFMIDVLYMRAYFASVSFALGQPPLFGSNFGIRADEWKKIANTTHLREHQNIHDDIDISYHLTGGVHYDAAMKMPISARPFRTIHKLPHRYIAGFRSIFIHWPEHAPWNNIKN